MRNLFIITLLFLCSEIQAQVKIGTTAGAAHASAALEVESTTRGVLFPRMTSTQRTAISSPATGLVIYNTTLGCMEMYNGTSWGCLSQVSGNPAALGSSFTSFSNGTAMFSTNAACTTSMISAGHNTASCSGSLNVGSNSYNLVLINGQCWMQTNLKEAPSNFAYNNTWLNTSLSDFGRWGYYNTSTTNGSAGFQSTEPAAGEGLLYQWSAAMNGSTTERAQGVCPTGWHVPSDCEWMYLEHGLGMSVTDQNATSWRSSGTVGSDLSTLTSGGTNSSGFTALLTGSRVSSTGQFGSRGSFGDTWSSSLSGGNAYYRAIGSSQTGVYRLLYATSNAVCVRCLKD